MTYFAERLPGNAGYRVVIGPAFENFPGPDPVDDVERYNRLLEAADSLGAGSVLLGAPPLQGTEQRLSRLLRPRFPQS